MPVGQKDNLGKCAQQPELWWSQQQKPIEGHLPEQQLCLGAQDLPYNSTPPLLLLWLGLCVDLRQPDIIC
jgi:hypothetical protein